MDTMVGKPRELKQVNLSMARRAIKERGTATRGEVVQSTGLSVTTVRALLIEMLEAGEIEEIGVDASSGGRKAARYALKTDRFFGAGFCLDGDAVRYVIADVCGDIRESGAFGAGGNPARAISDFLDGREGGADIRSIGVGVPGIVDGLSYRRINAAGSWERIPLGEALYERYGVPVVLENDLNATALGVGRRYLRTLPEIACADLNIAYLHFTESCLSAGFLANGRILRGHGNFVGELGLYPVSGAQTLDEVLFAGLTDERYAEVVARVAAGVCCVLNPQHIALGGAGFRKELLPEIERRLNASLPEGLCAELVYTEDGRQDYAEGIAYLTSSLIFSSVVLTRELP